VSETFRIHEGEIATLIADEVYRGVAGLDEMVNVKDAQAVVVEAGDIILSAVVNITLVNGQTFEVTIKETSA